MKYIHIKLSQIYNRYQISSLFCVFLLCTMLARIVSSAPASSPTDEDEYASHHQALHTSAITVNDQQVLSSSSSSSSSLLPHKAHLFNNKNSQKDIEWYPYRIIIGNGVKHALDACQAKFKWERWNCPAKSFVSVLYHASREPLPSNKELAFTRALIASGIVLEMIRSCSIGSANSMCSCTVPATEASLVSGDFISNENHFKWSGCDEIVKLGFEVAKRFLKSQSPQQSEANRLIEKHNFEAGRQAVKRSLKRKCKCHGASGACQVQTCWPVAPDVNQVAEYLRHQYRVAAKVGAHTSNDTDAKSLTKELSSIGREKLVFVDPSPDYCYYNEQMGVEGTLGRNCSRTRHRPDGSEVSRSERDSCDRLCTKCGYKVKREESKKEKQCDCRFVYCCSVECRRCPIVEETYTCVRHS